MGVEQMPVNLPLIRSHLYAPGNNSGSLETATFAGADAVVFDLETAAPPGEKVRARDMVAEAVRARAGQPEPACFVRINHPATGLAEDDVNAVVQPGLAGIRIPKVEDAKTVVRVADWVERAEAAAGLPPESIVLIAVVETAVGVFRALDIATASPRMVAIGWGTADLTADLGLIHGPDRLETLYIRSHLVLVSRVADLWPPPDSAYRQREDLEGLERETRQSRALGFFGKSALHPRQVPIINKIFTPTSAEVAHAREVVAAAEERRSGTISPLAEKSIDIGAVRRAQAILALVERLGLADGSTA